MKTPYLISDIGINHNGDIQVAKKLVDASFACNWNCVKFQKRNPELCVPEHQKRVMKDTPWGRMTYLEYKYRIEFGKSEYDYIDKYCKEKPIDWAASVWDLDSLEFIMQYKVPFVKIPSAKITDLDLLDASANTYRTLIISTGMSTIDEIDKAVEIVRRYHNNIIIMHCNSSYPSPLEDLNLKVILYLKNKYGNIIGYSGHEYGLEPTVTAMVLGAEVIERHITLDHDMWGSDHFASIEVSAMDILRRRIDSIPIVLGDGIKRITEKEKEVLKKLRG